METTTTPTTTPQDPVKGQFAAALRQYQYYSHGRSIRKFCEDEGLDYQKFCKYAREHGPGSDADKQAASAASPGIIISKPPSSLHYQRHDGQFHHDSASWLWILPRH